MRGSRTLTAVVLAGALLLGGCGDDDNGNGSEPTDPAGTAGTAGPVVPTVTTAPTPTPTPTPTAATPAPTATATDTAGTYEVQDGDTLSGIATQLGTTVDALVAENNIADPNSILPGQILQIPADAAP